MKANVNIRKAVIAMLTSASLAACSESGIESTIKTTTDEVAFNVAVKQVDTVSVLPKPARQPMAWGFL